MGFFSLLIVFISGAIFGTGALVVGLIFALNVGSESLDAQRARAAEKRKKFTHLDAKKWMPKPRTVQVVATAAARTRERAASVSTSSSAPLLLLTVSQPAALLRKLVIELQESTNVTLGTSNTVDASVRIRLGEQRAKSRTLVKISGLARVRFSVPAACYFRVLPDFG